MNPHIRHNISPVAWSSSSKLGTRCYIGAVSSSRKCCRPFVRCLVDYNLVRLFRILREASEMPPYAMAINRPRHLARIPLENLSSNTSRAWPVRAKPSPRFSPAKPGDDQQTKPPRTIASPSAEVLPSSDALQRTPSMPKRGISSTSLREPLCPHTDRSPQGWGHLSLFRVRACDGSTRRDPPAVVPPAQSSLSRQFNPKGRFLVSTGDGAGV